MPANTLAATLFDELAEVALRRDRHLLLRVTGMYLQTFGRFPECQEDGIDVVPIVLATQDFLEAIEAIPSLRPWKPKRYPVKK